MRGCPPALPQLAVARPRVPVLPLLWLLADVAKALACPVFHVNADDAVRGLLARHTCSASHAAGATPANLAASLSSASLPLTAIDKQNPTTGPAAPCRSTGCAFTANASLVTFAPPPPASCLQEAVVRVFELAAEWRQTWKSDVVIDLIGYRRYGCAWQRLFLLSTRSVRRAGWWLGWQVAGLRAACTCHLIPSLTGAMGDRRAHDALLVLASLLGPGRTI